MALLTMRVLEYFEETGKLVMPDEVPKSFVPRVKKELAPPSGADNAHEPFVKRLDMDPNIDPNHDIVIEHMVGEWAGIPYGELSVILVHLRYLAHMHQTHHWVCKGDPFYGDHLLFERLYNTVVSEIDALAEKAVGLGSEKNVDLSLQLKQLEKLCSGAYGMTQTIPQATELVKRSLAAERNFIKTVSIMSAALKEQGILTRGLDNMLAGVEDVHESHVYLLKQRCQKGL